MRTVWDIDPAIAVHMMERFKSPSAHGEVEKLVRANPMDVVNTSEALRFLVDESSRSHQKRDIKVIEMHSVLTLYLHLS